MFKLKTTPGFFLFPILNHEVLVLYCCVLSFHYHWNWRVQQIGVHMDHISGHIMISKANGVMEYEDNGQLDNNKYRIRNINLLAFSSMCHIIQ